MLTICLKNPQVRAVYPGIGRVEANNLNTRGTGMGLKTLDKILKYFKENKILNITYHFIDKQDNSGTKAIINLRVL